MGGEGRRPGYLPARSLQRFLRLIAVQRFFLRHWMLLSVTAVVLVGPTAYAMTYIRARGLGSLLNQMILYVDMIVPLWALVAGAMVWRDADPRHRPLLVTLSRDMALLAACKLAAVLIPLFALAVFTELSLPPLHAWVVFSLTGGPDVWPLAPGALFLRAVSGGILFAALSAAGGICGLSWAGIAAAALVWLLKMVPGVAWSKALPTTVLHAGWSAGGYVSPGTLVTVAAGVAVSVLTMAVASSTQRGSTWRGILRLPGRFYRLVSRQLPLLRHPGLFWTILGVCSIPALLILLHQTGRLADARLVRGFCAFHEQWLPLVALVAGDLLWTDKDERHTAILSAWPVRPALMAVMKPVIAFVGFILLAYTSAALSEAALAKLTWTEPVPPASWLFSHSLASGALLLGLATLGAMAGGSWSGLLLGAAAWLLHAAAPGLFAGTWGGAS